MQEDVEAEREGNDEQGIPVTKGVLIIQQGIPMAEGVLIIQQGIPVAEGIRIIKQVTNYSIVLAGKSTPRHRTFSSLPFRK